MKKVRNVLAGLCILALLLGLCPAYAQTSDTSVNVTVQISDADTYYLEPTTLTIEAGTAGLLFGEEPKNYPAGMDALIEGLYYSLYQEDLDPTSFTEEDKELLLASLGTTSSSGWLNGIYGQENTSDMSWMYSVNKTSPMDMCSTYTLTEGDTVWFYFCDWTYAYRGYAESLPNNQVKVTGVPILTEMYGTFEEKPIPAIVHMGSTDFACDDNGVATITGLTPGEYQATATWEDDEVGYFLLPPLFTVTVEEDLPEPDTPTIEDPPIVEVPPVTPPINSVPKVTLQQIKDNAILPAVLNEATDDIDCFWPMLAVSSVNGLTKTNIDYTKLSYEDMSAQRLAKVLIAMANDGYDVTTKLYNGKSIPELLVSYLQSDGSFNNINQTDKKGNPYSIYSTDQVWPIIALEIIDYSYDSDKAFSYLLSLQNLDGGFGYATYSDVGTTSWVLTACQLLNKTFPTGAQDYITAQWSTLVASNDSSSMSAYLSTGLATEEQVAEFLDTSYNPTGKYFTWGTDTSKNEYATATGYQCVGDLLNTSIYTRLDSACTPQYNKVPDKPSIPDTGSDDVTKPTEPEVPDIPKPVLPKDTYTVTLDFPNLLTAYEVKGNNLSAYDAVLEALKAEGLTYSASKGYISWVKVYGEKIGYGYEGNGFDGLMYKVNGNSPSVGLSSYTLRDGDSVYFYYTSDYTQENSTVSEPSTNTGGDNKVTTKPTDVPTTEVPKDQTTSKKFDDVPSGHWAETAIQWCRDNNYMNGIGGNNFSPEAKLTRAQLIQVLYNAMGNREKHLHAFLDNKEDSWYSDALNWAYAKGIARGYSDGRFGINDTVTRQDLAVFMARALGYTGSSSKFSDDADISAYAKDAVYALSSQGIINGKGNNTFDPHSGTTRAQCAQVIYKIFSSK